MPRPDRVYHKLCKKSKDKHIERSSYVLNEKGELCIAVYHDNGRKGRKAWTKGCKTTAMDETHSHVCTSDLFESGVTIDWQGGIAARMQHTWNNTLPHLLRSRQVRTGRTDWEDQTSPENNKSRLLGLHL